MIEAILAILAVIAYFGGVATKDFIRPALPQRKISATPKMEFKIPRALDEIGSESAYVNKKKWRDEWLDYGGGADAMDKFHHYSRLADTWPRLAVGSTLVKKAMKIHNSTQDFDVRSNIYVLVQNHIVPAYNDYVNGGELKKYHTILDLVEKHVNALEQTFKNPTVSNQDVHIAYLKSLTEALNRPIDQNLDLTQLNR